MQYFGGDNRSKQTVPIFEHSLQKPGCMVRGNRRMRRVPIRCRRRGPGGRGRRLRGLFRPLLRRRTLLLQCVQRRQDNVHAYCFAVGVTDGEPLSAADATLLEIAPRMSASAWMFFIL